MIGTRKLRNTSATLSLTSGKPTSSLLTKTKKTKTEEKKKTKEKQIHEKRERVTDRQADTGRQTDRDRQTEKNTIEQRFDRQANSWHCVIVWCVLW